MCICDTCGRIYSRFIFKLSYGNNIFTPKYKCHECRKKLRVLNEKEILSENYKCPNCNNEIQFEESGLWD